MIIAFTGAGISKASGIPTFDEMGDLREKLERNFATRHKDEFDSIMAQLSATCEQAEPNDAHMALAEYNIPVITMNIDSLHVRAGSKNVLEVHGSLRENNVVLYGDSAPVYTEALDWVDRLGNKDTILIIGTSFYTTFSSQLKRTAENNDVNIVVINADAEHEVRKYLEENQECIEDFESFIKRTPTWRYHCSIYDY
jgi:NAD-dependent deacetylase